MITPPPRTPVATALTVYGIETVTIKIHSFPFNDKLQQLLPFTVLKLEYDTNQIRCLVATALTVYGIETHGAVDYQP